jgi:hypothetical protein
MPFRIIGTSFDGQVTGKSSLTAKEAHEALQDAIANKGPGVVIWQAEDEQTGERYDENGLKHLIGRK